MPEERLAILVPDGAYPEVLREFLAKRRPSLKIRDVECDVIKDAFHDSSAQAAPLLRPYLKSCKYALVVRDLHGSGAERRGAAALEKEIAEELCANGWTNDRIAVVVVEPEIEAWLRFDSTHMATLIQERARRNRDNAALLFPTVRDKVIAANGGLSANGKPACPKEAFWALLREFGIQRSNALYGVLAGKESLQGCSVPSFQRLVAVLQKWFPA